MCLGGVLAKRDFHLKGLRDSKKMTAKARAGKIDDIYANSIETFGVLRGAGFIVEHGHFESWVSAAVELVSVMLRAAPDPTATAVIIDGREHDKVREEIYYLFPRTPLFFCVEADDLVPQVAAASVMAKVYRDTLMRDLEVQCPGYMWAKNKGYGVPDHVEGLERLGATEHHREHARKSWPIRAISP